MSYSSVDNPFYWRERAAEARRFADFLTVATAREHMLSSAESYDRLAEMAAKREIAAQIEANPSF
jgi:hypothetical protein